MVLDVRVQVLRFRARAAHLVITILRRPQLFANDIEFFLVFLDFFADEIALAPVLHILLTLHKIHGLDLHLLQQVLRLRVLFWVLIRFEIHGHPLIIFEHRAHSTYLLNELALVAVE